MSNDLGGYVLEPIDGFTVSIFDPKNKRLFDKAVEDAELIVKAGLHLEWADGHFVVHRIQLENQNTKKVYPMWRVSDRTHGSCVVEDYEKEPCIRKAQRVLQTQDKEKFDEALKKFSEIAEASMSNDTERLLKLIQYNTGGGHVA